MATLGEQIKAARKEKRLSLQQLASQLGVTVAAVSQWETGASSPSNKNRAKLGSLLNLSASDLIGVYDQSSALKPQNISATVVPIEFQDNPVPIYGHTVGEGGVLHIERRVINMIPRTDYLRYSQYAFGIECMGDQMAPVFERRDVVIINPDRAVTQGDDVVLVRGFEPKSIEPFVGILRRLLVETDTHWAVRQYNPPKDYKLAKADWPRALHVAGKRSR